VLEAMKADGGENSQVLSLRVDGGATKNNLLMQFQSDLLGVPLQRPVVNETTALGSAYAAGLAVGYFHSLNEVKESWKCDKTWKPDMSHEKRDALTKSWSKAIEKSLNWAE